MSNSAANNSKLSAALSLANSGYAVFPIYEATANGKCSCRKSKCPRPAKHPRTSDGFKSATKDIEKISAWWTKNPNASIGVATGEISGFFALDIDPKNGGDGSLRKLIAEHGELPTTILSLTGGGGQHYLFNYPTNIKIPNKTNLKPGIDIRGDGGYIVVPPSNHISGGNYQWAESKAPNQAHLNTAPDWLIELTNQKSVHKTEVLESPGVFLEGGRNSKLTSLGGGLRQKGLNPDAILATLNLINKSSCKPPLSDHEVQSIVQSLTKYPIQDTKTITWGDMQELPNKTLRAPLLEHKLIPRPFRNWILDVSERMQVLPDFIAPMMIVVAASVIGRQIAIRPKENDSYEVIPNIWGALIAPPSTLKTPAISEAMAPLTKLAGEAAAQYLKEKEDTEFKVYEIESEIKMLEKQISRSREDRDAVMTEIKNLKLELKKHQPHHRRFFTSDSTIEKLAIILSEDNSGILVQRDELFGFLNSFEKIGRESDRAFYLEGWSGNGHFQIDRVSRESNFVKGLCISILGGIQPSRLKQYIFEVTSGSAGNDGLIQRFQMMVYPEPKKHWTLVDRTPLWNEKEKVNLIFAELAEIDILDLNALQNSEYEIPYLKFDAEAQLIYNEWITKLENQLLEKDTENEAMRTHLGKYRSLMPSLSLIFYLLYYAENKMFEGPIPAWAARLAIKWCEYLEAHAKKVYGLLGELQLDSVMAFIKKVKDSKIKDGDSLRDIYRHHWSNLDNTRKVENAVAMLTELGWCQTQYISNGGAPSEIIKLNPKWLDLIKSSDKTAKSNTTQGSGTSDTPISEQMH